MNFLKLLVFVIPIFISLYSIWFWFCTQFWLFLLFSNFCVASALLVISWSIGYWFYDLFNTGKVCSYGKIVLITGCDSGFGHELSIKLDECGFHVFAGVLSPEGVGAQKLRKICSPNIRVMQMDVTKVDEVENVIREIEKSNGLQLWAVVNNAGIVMEAFSDWGEDVQVFRDVLEVNLFGLICVTKECLPLLRESNGRIVNVASLADRMTIPCTSHYCIAKHGVRVFSDALRREFLLNNDAIQVITIEPAVYQTQIINRENSQKNTERIFSETPEEIKKFYDFSQIHKMYNSLHNFVECIASEKVHEVVDAMAKGVMLKEPKQFYRCCSYPEVMGWAISHGPEILLDLFMYWHSKLVGKFY